MRGVVRIPMLESRKENRLQLRASSALLGDALL